MEPHCGYISCSLGFHWLTFHFSFSHCLKTMQFKRWSLFSFVEICPFPELFGVQFKDPGIYWTHSTKQTDGRSKVWDVFLMHDMTAIPSFSKLLEFIVKQFIVGVIKSKWMCFRHARKHFSQAEGGQLDEVRQVMGMLAFPSDTHISPYKVNCISVSILSEICLPLQGTVFDIDH